jgi:hypothetical protein
MTFSPIRKHMGPCPASNQPTVPETAFSERVHPDVLGPDSDTPLGLKQPEHDVKKFLSAALNTPWPPTTCDSEGFGIRAAAGRKQARPRGDAEAPS